MTKYKAVCIGGPIGGQTILSSRDYFHVMPPTPTGSVTRVDPPSPKPITYDSYHLVYVCSMVPMWIFHDQRLTEGENMENALNLLAKTYQQHAS